MMEKEKRIEFAESKRIGIRFYSNTIPDLYAEGYLDKGEIKTRIFLEILDSYIDSKDSYQQQLLTRLKILLKVRSIFNIILTSFCIFICKNLCLTLASLYFSVTASRKLFIYLYLIYELKLRNDSGRQAGRFHAAEHMAVNAYKKLQCVPTLIEIKKFSRFHIRCTSNKIVSNILKNLLISLSTAFILNWNLLLYIVFIICIHILINISLKKGLFRCFQIFVTSKPNDIELQVAIEGLNCFEEMENEISSNKNINIMLRNIFKIFNFNLSF